MLLDNCQLFCQLLCEVIAGKEHTEKVRELMQGKSSIMIPVACSFAAEPVYVVTSTLHNMLHKHCDQDSQIIATVAEQLDSFDKWYHHPRVYRARMETYEKMGSFMDSLGRDQLESVRKMFTS
jgi:hypothetical protein